MGYRLHIETATEHCSVVLSDGIACLASRERIEERFVHAKQLHVFIAEVLNEVNILPAQLEFVSVSEGPGSFTGLRIGSVAAKGLCYALDIPLIPLSTLRILAAPHWEQTKVVALLDARRDEVYTATYALGGAECSSPEAHILTPDSFTALADENVCFVGTGAEKAQEILPQNTLWKFIPTHPNATAMPTLAQTANAQQQYAALSAFAPIYIKPVRITPSKKDALGRVV